MRDERFTAAKSSTFEEFTETLSMLIREVYGNTVTFSEEFPSNSDPEKQPTPYIAYSVQSRKVTENRAIKQSMHSHFPDPHNEGETITPLRKWFDYEVHFSIFAGTNRESRQWAEELESLVERYKGLIKNSGVSEIIFLEEVKEEISSSYRQDLSMRTLKYLVRIERISELKSVEFKRIEASIQTGKDSDEREYHVVAEKEKGSTQSESFLELYEKSNHSFQKKEEQ